MFLRKTICVLIFILFFNSCSKSPKEGTALPIQDNKDLQINQSYHPKTEKEPESVEHPVSSSEEIITESTSSTELITELTPPKEIITESTPSTEDQAHLTPSFLISYEKQSIDAIGLNTIIDLNLTKEKANEILTLEYDDQNNKQSFYKEKIFINWNEEGQAVNINLRDQQVAWDIPNIDLLFNEEISFNDTTEITAFLINLYNNFEKTNIDCFKEKKCELSVPFPNSIIFSLPKIQLVFFSDIKQNTLTLLGIRISKDNPIEIKDSPIENQSQNLSEDNSSANPLLISYEKQSIGPIDLSVTKEQANQILNLLKKEGDLSIYEGGIWLIWNEEGKAVEILATQGDFTFNTPNVHSPISINQAISFNDNTEFNSFLIDLYNIFEKTNINCFKEKKCFIGTDPINLPPSSFIFLIPKMKFLFENPSGYSIKLISISFEPDNKNYKNMIEQAQALKEDVVSLSQDSANTQTGTGQAQTNK